MLFLALDRGDLDHVEREFERAASQVLTTGLRFRNSFLRHMSWPIRWR